MRTKVPYYICPCTLMCVRVRSSKMFSSHRQACGAERQLKLGEGYKCGGADLLAADNGVHGVVQRLWSPQTMCTCDNKLGREGPCVSDYGNLQGNLRGTPNPFSSFLFLFFSQSHTSVNFILLAIPSPFLGNEKKKLKTDDFFSPLLSFHP